MSYQVDITPDPDRRSAVYQNVSAELAGLRLVGDDPLAETWIPWQRIDSVTITRLDSAVPLPETPDVPRRPVSRRRAR